MSDNNTNISTPKTSDKNSKTVFFRKRKGCPLSVAGAPIVDYKNPDELRRRVSEGGRMLPRRVTNVSAKKQRELKKHIKIGRILALLPYIYIG